MDASQLVKGLLDVAVLATVREQDGYGYDVVRRLRAAGLDEVGDASVYGTLRSTRAVRSRATSSRVTKGRTASTTPSTTGAATCSNKAVRPGGSSPTPLTGSSAARGASRDRPGDLAVRAGVPGRRKG
jgi:hypothetical protein